MGFCNLIQCPLLNWVCPTEDKERDSCHVKTLHASLVRLMSEVRQSGRQTGTLEIINHPKACQVTRTKHTYVIIRMMSLVPSASSCQNSAGCCLTESKSVCPRPFVSFLLLLSDLSQLSTTVHCVLSFSFNTLNLILNRIRSVLYIHCFLVWKFY